MTCPPWRWRPRRRSPARPRSRSSSTARPRPDAGWRTPGISTATASSTMPRARAHRPTFAAGTYSVRLQVTDASGRPRPSRRRSPSPRARRRPPGAASRAVLTGAHVKARLIHRRRPIVERPDGTVALRVHCPSPTTCAGTVAIRALTGGPILGRARFRVAARHTVTVRVRLTAPARRRSHSPSPAARDLHPVAGARTRDQLAHRHGLHAACPGTAALRRATVAEDTLAGRRSLVDPPRPADRVSPARGPCPACSGRARCPACRGPAA